MPYRSLMLVLALHLALAAVRAGASADDPDGSGFDSMRIEQEEKLLVPLEIADDVLAFLKRRYVEDAGRLAQLDPGFTSYVHVEDFTDVYYDTPDLRLLAMQSGVRHRTRFNLSDPDHRKSGRQLMQIKVNAITSNPLERGEIKFAVERPGRLASPEDAHPMLGLVKRAQREAFKQRLVELGLDPQPMRPVLTVRDLRTRVYVDRDGQPFMSISFDQARSELLWAEHHFVEIEPELNEIAFTEADPAARRYMESILAQVVAELRAEFPAIESDLTPKYNKSFSGLESEIPMLRRLVAMNLHSVQPLASLVIGAIVALGLAAAVAWRAVSAARRRQLSRAAGPIA